ncbi:MAG: glycosyltransferase family 4 protein [Caulobacteraceae bacterium]|nr:glycosyltransferase family 4 protein [Caulobacteraceae bacterium]
MPHAVGGSGASGIERSFAPTSATERVGRLALIGNALPRRCGIATFTNDLQNALAGARPALHSSVVAMTDRGQGYDYPPLVGFQIHDDEPHDYLLAADFLNAGRFDAVSLQHEFGIFGGEAGDFLLPLLSRLSMPVVTTLHTVLAEPNPIQRVVLDQIIARSAKVVVMAEKGRRLLQEGYGVAADKIEVIPHGIPDIPFSEPDEAKAALGFSGRSVILTFGLLSPNKGLEVVIDAMPAILRRCPDAVYVVLGATHPNLVRREGEAYRESLMARAEGLGVAERVVFLDRFVDQSTLLGFIAMADVYVTPYLNEAQMTSGTLAYSFGLGKAVVSTPYWHAQELLADGRGVLTPFGDSAAIGAEIADLLTDADRRQAMRLRAYASSRSMTWARTAQRYLGVFDEARAKSAFGRARPAAGVSSTAPRRRPELRLGHLTAMCDDTGLFQHAVHAVPDRAHGYCVDDNARALLLASLLNDPAEQSLPEAMSERFAAFVQHAWNPDNRRFRNFMSFDRRWLEDVGSEDSHGRTLWALGACARDGASAPSRRWASALFAQALTTVESFSSPRAWAFTLLGLDAYCAAQPRDAEAASMRVLLARRILTQLQATETAEWVWFERGLGYDNARLCQALIVTGQATGAADLLDAGLRTLTWLIARQTAPLGHFRPVGSDTFGDQRKAPRAFDQQPVEAAATISACLAASVADGAPAWAAEAERAFAWFLGENDLATPLVDLDTGGCRDGLHPDRANENRGAESVLSYLLGLAELRRHARQSQGDIALVSAVAVRV